MTGTAWSLLFLRVDSCFLLASGSYLNSLGPVGLRLSLLLFATLITILVLGPAFLLSDCFWSRSPSSLFGLASIHDRFGWGFDAPSTFFPWVTGDCCTWFTPIDPFDLLSAFAVVPALLARFTLVLLAGDYHYILPAGDVLPALRSFDGNSSYGLLASRFLSSLS